MILVISAKGGVGKSFVSANVIAPALYIKEQRKIKLAELDTENFTSNYLLGSNIIEATSIDLSQYKNNDIQLQNIISSILEKQEYDIIDVGSNMAVEVTKTIETGLGFLISYVFIPTALHNSSETELAIRMIETLLSFGYDKEKIYVIANKYIESETSMLNMQSIPLPTEQIIKIPTTNIHDIVMTNTITLYDIYMKVDIEKNREEIRKAIQEKNHKKAAELSKINLYKQKAAEFYANPDFQRLVNFLGD